MPTPFSFVPHVLIVRDERRRKMAVLSPVDDDGGASSCGDQ